MYLLSPGILYSAFRLFHLITEYQINDSSLLRNFPKIEGVITKYVLEIALKCDWILIQNGNLTLTSTSTRYNSSFDTGVQRSMIKDYILAYKPVWAKMMIFGRGEAIPMMPVDVQYCFYDAGLLLTPPSQDIIEWWDMICGTLRKDTTEKALKIGREGEQLSCLYEEKRTGKKPLWQSIETNKAGYDILSICSKENPEYLNIEVKTSSDDIEQAFAYITKNEWKTALYSKHYQFHFWCLKNRNCRPKLAILSANEMEPHISINVGMGEWNSVKVPFSPFKDLFEEQSL